MTLDLSLSAPQHLLRERVRDCVARHCPPEYVRTLDEEARFPRELYAELLAGGLPGLHGAPGEGAGVAVVELAITCEELARTSAALALAYGTSIVAGAWALMRYGTTEQQRSLLSQFVEGKALFTFAATEMATGFEAIATFADALPDGYCLTGMEMLIPGAHVADYLLIAARSATTAQDEDALTLFYVPRDAPGLSVTPVDQMGDRALTTCAVDIAEVRVPPEALLGQRHQGRVILGPLMGLCRLVVAAASTGLAQGAFEQVLAYALRSHNGARPIGDSQAVQHALAALHTRIEAARLLVYYAGWYADIGNDCAPRAAIAKQYATEAASRTVSLGMRLLGPTGNRRDCAMQRYFRDAKPLETAAGCAETDKDCIAGSVGL
ncbi:MAG: acyl-CoA dehydrogenase family protein [Candidatus Binatia bacterium]